MINLKIMKLQSKKSQKNTIYMTRLFAQAAEKFGWTIGGFALAFEISGSTGVMALSLSMLSLATIASGMLSRYRILFAPSMIRRALKWRSISFLLMFLGYHVNHLAPVIFGGATSGIFVGMFWPTFYRIQTIEGSDFSEWYSFEKACGIILTGFSGPAIAFLGVAPVMLLSLVAVLMSYSFSLRLKEDGFHCDEVNEIDLSKNRFSLEDLRSFPSLLALIEGCFNSMANLTRLLVMLTGTVVVQGLPGYISLAILLPVSGFCGAIFTWILERFVHRHREIEIGLILSVVSCSLLLSEKTWFIGMIGLTSGSAVIFPVLKKGVEDGLSELGLGGRGLREFSRNIGRLGGSIIISAIWTINPQLFNSTLAIIASIVLLAMFWAIGKNMLNSHNHILGHQSEYSI